MAASADSSRAFGAPGRTAMRCTVSESVSASHRNARTSIHVRRRLEPPTHDDVEPEDAVAVLGRCRLSDDAVTSVLRHDQINEIFQVQRLVRKVHLSDEPDAGSDHREMD